jgi:hypothetical protein
MGVSEGGVIPARSGYRGVAGFEVEDWKGAHMYIGGGVLLLILIILLIIFLL